MTTNTNTVAVNVTGSEMGVTSKEWYAAFAALSISECERLAAVWASRGGEVAQHSITIPDIRYRAEMCAGDAQTVAGHAAWPSCLGGGQLAHHERVRQLAEMRQL